MNPVGKLKLRLSVKTLRVKKNILMFLICVILLFAACRTEPSQPSQWEKIAGFEIYGLEEDSLPDKSPYLGIVFLNKDIGIVISAGSVQRSKDGGRSWQYVSPPDYSYFSLILHQGIPYISGKNNKNEAVILRSDDSGRNWYEIEVKGWENANVKEAFSAFYGLCFTSDTEGWVVGAGGVLKFNLEGANVEFTNTFSTTALDNVSCGNKGTIWANSLKEVFRFTNKWEIIDLRPIVSSVWEIRKIVSTDSGVWVLGSTLSSENRFLKSIVLNSSDDGKTWKDLSDQINAPVEDIYMNEEIGWLVGAAGNIFFTNDRGVTWQKIQSPTKNNLYNIFLNHDGFGWIAGAQGTLIRTENILNN